MDKRIVTTCRVMMLLFPTEFVDVVVRAPPLALVLFFSGDRGSAIR